METITLEKIHNDILGLKEEIKQMRVFIEEDFEIADDVIKEIEESQKRPEKEFISHKEMGNEFG